MEKIKASKLKILDELIRYINYNPDLGIFTWKVNFIVNKIGKKVPVNINERVGVWGKGGYRFINFKKQRYPEHRVAWYFVFGYIPKYLDHKNGIVDDNRILNLRECTLKQNNYNRIGNKNKIKYKGVFFRKLKNINKYEAAIKINSRSKFLGYYSTPIEAAKVYDENAKKLFGEFAKTNF